MVRILPLVTLAMLVIGLGLLITGIILKKKDNPSSAQFKVAAVIILLISCFLTVLSWIVSK